MLINKSIELEKETGEFLVCGYGNGIALGFRGDNEFIKRCRNFIYNFGISRKKLSTLGIGAIYYVCTTYEKLRSALNQYYRYQVTSRGILSPESYNEIDEIKYRVYNESSLSAKTSELVESFISNCLISNNFMYGISENGMVESKLI